jgi:hypothetical protein
VRVLFDQGTPVPLRTYLKKHAVGTVYELGWSVLQNGELLQRAEPEGFDVFVTTDQNLRYQQAWPGRKLAIAVLLATSWPRIEKHVANVVAQIELLQVGGYVEISIH